MKTRNRKNKWVVYGEFGGEFTNLKEARDCAKFASTTEEYDFNAKIWLIDDGCWYIEYENGKVSRDGWTIKR